MSLPSSRNTTYVDGVTPVKAADLNDIQDQLIVLAAPPADSLHTDRRLTWIHAASAQPDNGSGTPPVYTNGEWVAGVGVGTLVYPINLEIGDRLQKWALQVRKTSATGTITVQVFQQNRVGASVFQVGTTQTLATNNPGYSVITEDMLDWPITAGGALMLLVTPSGITGDYFLDLAVQHTRPAIYSPVPS